MYVVVTQVQAQRGHVRPGPARARPGPGVPRAEGTGQRPATTGLRTGISNLFETVKSADFRSKMCVVNGGKYAFSLSGLVPNSELSGSRGVRPQYVYVFIYSDCPQRTQADREKNAPHLRSMADIFSQLATILRSAGTSEVRLILHVAWTRARPRAAHLSLGRALRGSLSCHDGLLS